MYNDQFGLVYVIFNEGAYLTFNPASNLISTRCRTNTLLISDRYRKQYLSDIALRIGFKSDQYLVGIVSGRYRAYIKIVVYPSLVLYPSDIGYKSFRLAKQTSSILCSGYLYTRSMTYKLICKRICIFIKKCNCKIMLKYQRSEKTVAKTGDTKFK